jgi:hypothetical protein
LAFDLIQPVVSGNLEVNSDEIPPELLGKAMRYTAETMLEVHDIRTNNRVAELLSTRVMDESVTNLFGAIDGLFIRFQRGQLGLERIGLIGSTLVSAKKRVVRGVLTVAG